MTASTTLATYSIMEGFMTPKAIVLALAYHLDPDRPLHQAVTLYLARQNRTAHPEGKCDQAGRWYPADAESRACCHSIRCPSRTWPWSLMQHGRTAEHVAALLDVDATELKRIARAVITHQRQSQRGR